MELLFSIKTGSFPLYVPGFASGHSSAALTLGQVFHPVSSLVSILPGYWDGKAIDWNNFFKLLSLGLAQLALFAFLRKLKLNMLFSFVISLITVYNLRILDLYRYGAPIEAYTAHLILCAAIGWYFINPTKWLGPLCIIGTTYLLVVSGHPQMMYYGLLGAGLFMFIVPFFLSDILDDRQVDYRTAIRFWLKVGFCLLLGIMLSSVYILPFYFDFISMNIDRVGQNYVWTNEALDTFMGTVNNFILPLRSESHGAFGGSSLILMAAILPIVRIFKIKIPRSVWAIWGLLMIMFLYMQGSRTPVHRLAWEYLPLVSSFRIPGRISMIMPVFIMLLLVWIVKEETYSFKLRRLSLTLRPLSILACISLLLIISYYLLHITGYYIFSLSIFKDLFRSYNIGHLFNVPFLWTEFIVIILGMASLIFLVIYSVRTGSARVPGLLLIMVMVVQMGIVLKYRAAFWIEKKYESPTFEAMQKQKRIKLDYLYYPGGGMHSSVVTIQLKRSFLEPFLGKIFTQVIPVDSRDDAYKRMERKRLPQEVFIEGYNPEKARTITEGAKNMKKGAVKLVYSSFNRMQFQVNSQAPAFFGLSYPYTGYWSAWVNGERVRVYRANGAAHAVEIPAGKSLIEFRYWSNAFFWGMFISCATFAVIGIFVCFRARNGLPRIIGIIIILIISTGGFMIWYNSLYSGNNLETEYTWTYTPPLKTPNLAYGKKNWLGPSATSSHWKFPWTKWHYRQQDLYVTRFVDGNHSPVSGFSTRLSNNPDWFLDLNRIQRIKTILLFESSQDTSVNARPVTVALSTDGNSWSKVASVISPVRRDGPARIVFERLQAARYIRIKASGKSILSFDEVEVYGPKDNE